MFHAASIAAEGARFRDSVGSLPLATGPRVAAQALLFARVLARRQHLGEGFRSSLARRRFGEPVAETRVGREWRVELPRIPGQDLDRETLRGVLRSSVPTVLEGAALDSAAVERWTPRFLAGLASEDVTADESHRAAVRALLSDRVPDVQTLAADAARFHVRASDVVHDALEAILASPHGKVRAAAAEALGYGARDDLAARLGRMAREDESDFVRVRAALGHWRASGRVETVRGVLLAALDHRRTEIRRLALRCIGELGKDAGPLVDAVAERLGDRSLRIAAMESLARLGPAAEAAIPALRELRSRSRPYTSRRIDAVLARIGG